MSAWAIWRLIVSLEPGVRVIVEDILKAVRDSKEREITARRAKEAALREEFVSEMRERLK